MGKAKTNPVKTCADCIHENACSAWNIGNIHNMDAYHCVNYGTVKDSAAYFIGFRDGEKSTMQDRVRGALAALGYDIEQHTITVLDSRVLLDGKYFGIWDDNRRTFVD